MARNVAQNTRRCMAGLGERFHPPSTLSLKYMPTPALTHTSSESHAVATFAFSLEYAGKSL